MNKFDPGGNDAGPVSTGEEYDPEENPPVYTTRTYIDDMIDVMRASGRIAYDAGAVAASVALPDFQELTNGDLTWNDALEVASIVPIGKVAKWGGKLLKGSETATEATKVADEAVDATRTVVIEAGQSSPFVEGIYEFSEGVQTYVGQAKDLSARLAQHINSGRLAPGSSVTVTEVLGGKTAREIAEHVRIQDVTGGVPARFSDIVSNKIDPIGAARRYLLGE